MQTSARAAYQNAEVMTMSQRDLIVKLYAGAERFLHDAAAAMDANRIEDAHVGCQRAKAIFAELAATLNFADGGEIALRLKELYSFFMAHIAQCNLRKDARELVRIVPLIANLRGAWEAIPQDLANTGVSDRSVGHTFDIAT